ncbi:MAG: hypothetical protein SFV54_12795 [Bryobacteraceae bacterium]|nr:hypothetical protein [Bryobacteraceae bacterium]
MSPQLLARLERLAAAQIEILPLPTIEKHFCLSRDGFVALVERRPDGFGKIGASGLLTSQGFAALVWRDGVPRFVAKGVDEPANPEQVESLRRFANDLESALR